MPLDLAGQTTSVSAPTPTGVNTMPLDTTQPPLPYGEKTTFATPMEKPSTINVTISDKIYTDWLKDPNKQADKQGRPTSYINADGQKVNIYQAGVALPTPTPLFTSSVILPPKTIGTSDSSYYTEWLKDPNKTADVYGRPTSYIDQTTGQKIIITQGAYTASVGSRPSSSGGTYTDMSGKTISRDSAMGMGAIDTPTSFGEKLAAINAPSPSPILAPVKVDTIIPTQGSISDLNPFGSIINANPMKPVSTPTPVVEKVIPSITSQFGVPSIPSILHPATPLSVPTEFKFYPPQPGSIAEQKAQADKYAAREKESISTPFLHATQDISKNLQSEADKLIGVTAKTAPGIGTFASGAASVLTSIPSMVGMGVFSGEQIIRHPTELAKVATVGVPLMVSQTVQSAKEDPFRFGGSVVGMIALGESGRIAGKVGETIKFSGKKYIPAETIIEPQVISGAERFPLAPKGTSGAQLVKEFKTSQYRIPGTEEKIGGWHATPSEFAKSTKAQVGTSESPGMYIAPSTSPHFLKLTPGETKLFGLGNKPSHPAAIFIETKGIERAPSNVRGDVSKYNEFMMTKAEKGKAFISSAFEKGIKPEKEAIIPPESPIERTSFEYYTKWEGKKVPLLEYKTKTTSVETPSTKIEPKTFGGLIESQSKAYSKYRGYREPIITPSTLLWGSVAKSTISSTKPYKTSSIVESNTPSPIKSVVSNVKSPVSSIVKNNIPSGISSLISGGKSSSIISSSKISTKPSQPPYYSPPKPSDGGDYYQPPKYEPPYTPEYPKPGYVPPYGGQYNSNEPLRPYADTYWNDPLKTEIPLDLPAFDKNGEKVISKKKRKIVYERKTRFSPIFGGAEKLFEGIQSPIKTSKKASIRKSQPKPTTMPTFDMGNLGFGESPIKTNKPKYKKTNKNVNKKPFWL